MRSCGAFEKWDVSKVQGITVLPIADVPSESSSDIIETMNKSGSLPSLYGVITEVNKPSDSRFDTATDSEPTVDK